MSVLLKNGQRMPIIGLGTYTNNEKEMVKKAIDIGYRLFDTAWIYRTEQLVGEAIKEKISEGTIKREDVFVITKLWNRHHRPEKVESTIKQSLSNLGLEYIDLYLMHWPVAVKDVEDPFDAASLEIEDVPIEDTWKAMEQCVTLGYTKSIGLSNFNSVQIEKILNIAKIKPVVNEVECNPYLNQKKLINFCKERNIEVVAYSPFWNKNLSPLKNPPSIWDEPIIKNLAEKYGKTLAQITLRYLIELGTIPIPKSGNEKRLKENLNVLDFKLDPADISALEKLNRNLRCCPFDQIKGSKEYPFSIEF